MPTFPVSTLYSIKDPSIKDKVAGNVNYRRFSEEYFSGSDISIYFDNVYIDEIKNLTFGLSEKVLPIYGYKSFKVDSWARGSRIVQGQFTINFKEAYYLHAVMDKIAETKSSGQSIIDSSGTTVIPIGSIEELLGATSEITNDGQFEALANEYQKAIWGETIAGESNKINNLMDARKYGTYFYTLDEVLKEKGFNIILKYGGDENNKNNFKINESGQENINGTIKSINNVQLTDCMQQVDDEGNPVFEVYQFYASDIDYNISG